MKNPETTHAETRREEIIAACEKLYETMNFKDITIKEIAAIVTHTAFYAGWPKAWAVFRLAKEVWGE